MKGFSHPCPLARAHTHTQSLTIEVSALVPTEGSGGVWTVGIGTSGGGDGNDTLYTVGDLAAAGNTDWTTIYLTVPLTADEATGSLASYMDDNNEMLITLSCSQPGSTQVCSVGGPAAAHCLVLQRGCTSKCAD